jgi:hypothetical protein
MHLGHKFKNEHFAIFFKRLARDTWRMSMTVVEGSGEGFKGQVEVQFLLLLLRWPRLFESDKLIIAKFGFIKITNSLGCTYYWQLTPKHQWPR